MIATLQQKCDADLASMPDVEVVEKGKELLTFCTRHLGTISGFEPDWWLEHLVSTESKAYLLRMALTALKQSQQLAASDFETSVSLARFRDACANISSEAANILQLMSSDFLADYDSAAVPKN